ncbi:MAG: tRNA 2-thiouridine(34) synthase MnmA [Betaproteobacteria bacterium AqS2]|uniref:tRNA-specific 2-thiouridylase MnmA n=1 Tax=Candidatus Amphirhobacter heronislandensis TaxID=1732024 RepID=A0A930UJ12_9GAMM|nr:tRNA 2-thiouridine(34) synthase MnmA [Betaproteobacteria bacterium AqS2]
MSAATPGPVAVGMSGGVDSSVAALLLKRAGHEVTGVFIRSWEDADGSCPANEDAAAAAAAADRIGVPLEAVDFTADYRERVFESFLAELRRGLTPNPDVWCNAAIKFDAFADHALGPLGAERFATGHYARAEPEGRGLLKAEDEDKDQSYFLFRMPPARLAQVLFPLGGLPKAEVRRLAKEAGLPNAERPESMGICFIGKRRLRDFLADYVELRPGAVLDADGHTIGEHAGALLYTVGQRHGLGLGGPGEPWYVAAKDVAANTVTAVRGRGHPALLTGKARLVDCHWLAEPPRPEWVYTCRHRHRMEPAPCTVAAGPDGTATVEFAAPQWAVAPGQAAVVYDGVRCLGGGAIAAAA